MSHLLTCPLIMGQRPSALLQLEDRTSLFSRTVNSWWSLWNSVVAMPCQVRLCYLFCLEMSFAASASFLDNTTLHSELCRGAISEVVPYYAFKLPHCGIDKGCNIGNGERLQQPRLLWHIFLVDLVTIPNNMVWYTNCNIWYQFLTQIPCFSAINNLQRL